MQFPGKLTNQTQKMAILGPIFPELGPLKLFLCVLHLLDVKHYCKLSLYAISRKTKDSNSRKWPKTWFWGSALGPWAQIWAANFFLKKIWFSQSLDTMVSYHYVQCQEKASDPILRKISDGWTDRLTDQREEPEWFHRRLFHWCWGSNKNSFSKPCSSVVM